MSGNEMDAMVSHFMEQVKMDDLINVGFMKPVELALRTHKVDSNLTADNLPQGLMIASKEKSIYDNKFKLKDLQAVNTELSLDQLRKNHQDNYVSLMKKPEGLELAVCICMYSEDKPMLKRTLMGVADNIDELIEKGMSPDDIFVCIVIDGIQKVDESLFDYFQEFERESQIFIDEDDELSMRQKYDSEVVNVEVDDKQPLNYSKFLFTSEEHTNRLERQFVNVREKYDDVVRIKKQIDGIKKDRSSKNQNLKMILNKIIDQQKSALQTMGGEVKGEEFNITEESIMKELSNSEEECDQYINARETLAYVSAYRLPTRSLSSRVAAREDREKADRMSADSQRDIKEELLSHSDRSDSGKLNEEEAAVQQPSRRNRKYVNMFFCIKYKNSGKLSSHNWFFNGFCNELKPKYSILLDVGLRPYPGALYKMYNYMKDNPDVGGVCGYMSLKIEKVEDEDMHSDQDLDWLSSIMSNFVDIQRAQQIEYHFAHLIDKPFESLFKFIHVLPGAFSGYNMNALRPVNKRDALLREYFKSIDEKLATNKVVPNSFSASQILMRVFLPKIIWKQFYPVDPDSEQQVLYNQNICLAEDRILCMGIHKNEFNIIFMPDAYAQVDPMKTVNGLMGQRKRWINGTTFAFEKVQKEMAEYKSEKMYVADIFLKIQIFYLNFSNFLVYFAPALLLFTYHLTMQTIAQDYLIDIFATDTPQSLGAIIYATFVNMTDFLYAMMILTIVFFSIHLTHSNKTFIYYIYLFSTIFGIFSFVTFVIFFVDVVKGFSGENNALQKAYADKLNKAMQGAGGLIDLLRYFIISSMGLYILPIVLYGAFFLRIGYLWQILTGTFSFLFFAPSYLNLLNIYALCRIDDISWGTKGLQAAVGGKNAKLKDTWKVVKMIDVAKFLIWNIIMGVILIVFDGYLIIKFFVTLSLLVLFSFVQAFKMFIGLVYLIKYKCYIEKKSRIVAEKREEADKPEMDMHIFKIVDAFEDGIRRNIKQSFESAALDTQEGMAQLAAQRLSKPNVALAFEQNKFKNIRADNQHRKSFYPDQKARNSRLIMKKINKDENTTVGLEMHLLQRKVEQEVKKQGGDNRESAVVFQDIRQTFLQNMQVGRKF